MRQGLLSSAVLVAVLSTISFRGAIAEDERPLSPAQIALFESDHLKQVNQPTVLDYAFRHHGGRAGDFEDKATADIRMVHEDGHKDVWVEFLTGDHHVNFPPALGFNGNPMLMFFLEHDVMEMRDATGGAAQYFRNRIRQSFVDHAILHPVEVTIDGKTQHGTEIEVTPFHNDPNLTRFPAFGEKTYHFILSEAVPGGIYQISTTLGNSAATSDAFEEWMTYAGEHKSAR